MIVWPPPSRARFAKDDHKPSRIRIMDAAGTLLREQEPEGGFPCRLHASRDCRRCEFVTQSYARREKPVVEEEE